MRLLMPSLALSTICLAPAISFASPFAIPLTTSDLVAADGSSAVAPSVTADASADVAAPADAAPVAEEPAAAPVAEPAPVAEEPADAPVTEEPAVEEPVAEEPTEEPAAEGPDEVVDPTEGDPTEGEVLEDEDDLEDELGGGPAKRGDFNANAIGFRGGLHLIPSYFLNAALASYSNALCRNEVGGWGEQNGLVKVDGCNYFIAGEYVRRVNRAVDVGVGVGYLHVQTPDSIWLDNGEWDRDTCTEDEGTGSSCDIGAADYTEIDLRMFTVELNVTGRGTLYRNPDVEIQLGGGGGLGLGILIGNGVRRTPLGVQPGSPGDSGSCQTLGDTADFRRCTPRYYDDLALDQDGDGDKADIKREDVDTMGGMGPDGLISTDSSFARCTRDKCDGGDLAAFGATETDGTWPVYPMVNLFGSFRVIIKDSFGISIEGGIKNGFFFGGGAHFFFGGGGKDKS